MSQPDRAPAVDARIAESADLSRIRAAVAAADPGILYASMFHLTGNEDWLRRGLIRQASSSSGSESWPEKAEIEATLIRHRGDAAPVERTTVSDDLLMEVAELVCGEPVPESYLPKIREELGLDAGLVPTDLSAVADPVIGWGQAVIIGAGPAGLRMGAELRKAGIPFTILEKESAVGGVWRDNTYPGCGVDTPSQLYSFGDFQKLDWTRYYPGRDEILAYFEAYASHSSVIDDVRFGCEVVRMDFSAERNEWMLSVRTEGSTELATMWARVVITCTGILNRPKIPNIEGMGTFEGSIFHTAQWDHEADLDGRVALVGNGSSGVQVGAYLASRAKRLVAFQRTPHWSEPKAQYHAAMPVSEHTLLRGLPLYAQWQRFKLYWKTGDADRDIYAVDTEWRGPGPNKRNLRRREELVEYIRTQVGGRADLMEKLVPSYPPYTKRMVVDNGWYRALTLPNVELTTQGIARIVPEGIIAADGTRYDLDTIVFATGFEDTRFLYPIDVHGAGGATFDELFGSDDDVRSYLGMTVPELPNLFSVMGPNSAIVGGSNLYTVECQARYIGQCVEYMARRGLTYFASRTDVRDDYNARMSDAMEHLIWTRPEAGARYQNRAGRVVINHPWTLQDYWAMTQTPDLSEYVVRQAFVTKEPTEEGERSA